MQNKFVLFLCFYVLLACNKNTNSILLYQKSLSVQPLFGILSINDSTQLIGGGQEFLQYELFRQTTSNRIWQSPIIATIFPKSILGFLQLNNGFILAYGTSGFMAASHNNGIDWKYMQLQNYKTVSGAAQVGNNIMLSCNPNGQGGIALIDTNGIILQEKAFTIGIKSIAMPSNNIGYATASGAIVKTLDGGISWNFTSAKNDIFTSILALTTNDCIVCGFDGSIQRTIDGGETWLKIKKQNSFSTTYRWNKIINVNPTKAFVVGDNGKMASINLLDNTYELLETFTNANLLNVYVKNKQILSIVTSDGNYCEVKL
jgi:hypothetical protein